MPLFIQSKNTNIFFLYSKQIYIDFKTLFKNKIY